MLRWRQRACSSFSSWHLALLSISFAISAGNFFCYLSLLRALIQNCHSVVVEQQIVLFEQQQSAICIHSMKMQLCWYCFYSVSLSMRVCVCHHGKMWSRRLLRKLPLRHTFQVFIKAVSPQKAGAYSDVRTARGTLLPSREQSVAQRSLTSMSTCV